MDRTIVWTAKAHTELIDILQYWIERNRSNKFSKKLNELIEGDLQLISKLPELGRMTDVPGVRVKSIQKYLLYYEFNNETLYILTIRHQKRDPDTLKLE